METSPVNVRLFARKKWWFGLAFKALIAAQRLGLIRSPEKAARFIAHAYRIGIEEI